MRKNLILGIVESFWSPVYEGDKEGNQTGTESKTGQEGSKTGQEGNKEKLLTQEEFNKALAEDRKKHKEQVDKHIKELEQLRKSQNLTAEEKKKLTAQIEELQQQVMTKEQLLEREKARLNTEHQGELKKEREEKENWKTRFTEATIVRSITDAAVTAEAFSPDQIVALLQNNTKLVEDTNEEGQGLGTFTPRVKFKDVTSDGKPTILDLSVPEAIKRMKDLPDKYGNLFKSNVTGGIGGTGSVGSNKVIDPKNIKTLADWKKNKEKLLARKT